MKMEESRVETEWCKVDRSDTEPARCPYFICALSSAGPFQLSDGVRVDQWTGTILDRGINMLSRTQGPKHAIDTSLNDFTPSCQSV